MRSLIVVLIWCVAVLSQAQFDFALNKTSVSGQNYVQGTITLDAPRPTSTTFTVYDNSSLVTTPPSVVIPANGNLQYFGIQTTAVNSTIQTFVYARLGAVIRMQPLTLAPLVPSAMAFEPNPVIGGQVVMCRLIVNGVAGPNGRTVAIFDNSAYSATPPTVVVPPGATQVIFPITTRQTAVLRTVVVTARVSAGEKSATFRILPGSANLILCSMYRDGIRNIYSMNEQGTDILQRTAYAYEDLQPDWSADGRRVAFVRDTGDYDIAVMNSDGSDVQVLTTDPFNDEDPAWSPDGSKIAFSAYRDGNYEIYVMNADGSGQTRLTNDPGTDRWPAWSPDGNKLAFSSDRDGTARIYSTDSGGANQQPISNPPPKGDYDPDWSPDGSRIVFQRGGFGSSAEIWTVTPDGLSEALITAEGQNSSPSWSPNGAQIAFCGVRPTDLGILQIYLIAANGSNLIRLTNEPQDVRSPAWGTPNF